MAIFTFTDFLIFTQATNVNEDAYATIAQGVLAYLKNQYGLYPESETITLRVFMEAGQTSIIPQAYPIESVYRIWYDDELLDDEQYTYYGEDIEFVTAFTDARKPVTFELDVGFTDGAIPYDLKLAIYRHMQAVYYAIDKNTDNISKVINSDGNTTYFVNDIIPLASKQTYEFYAGKYPARS